MRIFISAFPKMSLFRPVSAKKFKRWWLKHQADTIKVLLIAVVLSIAMTFFQPSEQTTPYIVPSLKSDITELALEFDTNQKPDWETSVYEHAASGRNSGTNQLIAGNYETLCEEFSQMCERVIFNGELEQTKKAEYFGEIVQVVLNTDEIKTIGYPLIKVLTQIAVNASKGARRGSSGRTKMTLNL